METILFQNLLQQVSTISRKYEELTKITGENFNIFKVLKVDTSEVRLHSAFIAELLNPKGNHGLGDSFLKLFVRSMSLGDFNTEKATVAVEKYTGYINEDCTDGGRIDLVVDDTKGRGIIIENKIYAADQNNQLLRYHNFGKAHFPGGFHLVYLTLYGDAPSGLSTGGEAIRPDDYQAISYQVHMKNWLEDCRKEASTHSTLRETITQYLNLIKYLTGQTINTSMETEIAELLASSKENIKAAYTLRKSEAIFDKMERKLLGKLQQELKAIAAQLNLRAEFDNDFGKVDGETYLHFWLPNQDLEITFGFERWRVDFNVGISGDSIDEGLKGKIQRSQLEAKLGASACKNGNYTNWYYLHYFKDRTLSLWDTADIWVQIQDGTLTQKLKGYLEICLTELNSFK